MSKSVLIVDDYPVLLAAVKMLLESAGYQVYTALSAAEAMDRLKLGVDAALLDYRMPDMNGLELIRWIREQPEMQDLLVIMLTASVLHGEESLDCGADYFMPKPMEVDDLLRLMEREIGDASSNSAA